MRNCCGVAMALTVLALLLVGPTYMALSAAKETPTRAACAPEASCDKFAKNFLTGD